MNDFLAKSAMQYLEDVIVPIVVSAARLPPQIGIEELPDLNLSDYSNRNSHTYNYSESCALEVCEERPILGISMITARLAHNVRANKICRNIIELMMRDAVDFHAARELTFSTNLEGIDNQEFELRYREAEKVWQRWEETDAKVILTLKEFALGIGETWESGGL
jgi:hypothetical protein